MIERIKGLIHDEEGASMPEYALLVALIAVVVIVGAGFLGKTIDNKLTNVGTQIETAR